VEGEGEAELEDGGAIVGDSLLRLFLRPAERSVLVLAGVVVVSLGVVGGVSKGFEVADCLKGVVVVTGFRAVLSAVMLES
jgi:hypothetical protein